MFFKPYLLPQFWNWRLRFFAFTSSFVSLTTAEEKFSMCNSVFEMFLFFNFFSKKINNYNCIAVPVFKVRNLLNIWNGSRYKAGIFVRVILKNTTFQNLFAFRNSGCATRLSNQAHPKIPHVNYRYSKHAICYCGTSVRNTIREETRRASLNVFKKEYKYDPIQQDS